MKVNGVDIAGYNAKQWNIEPGKRAVTNASEMLDGFSVPMMAPPSFGMREYAITVRIRGSSRTEIWNNAGRILRLFSGVSEVELDGIGGAGTRMFTLSLKGAEQEEYGRMKAGWGILRLTCVGYEHGGKMYALLDEELAVPGLDSESEEVEHIFAVDSKELQGQSLPSPPTTAPAITDLYIWQLNRCAEDGEIFSGLAGNYYPIYADVSIEGLCRDARGRDAGALRLSVSPRVNNVGAGPVNKYLPYPDGYGFYGLLVRGISGKAETWANRLPSPEAGGVMPYARIVSMPAPLVWGVPGQEVKVRITSYLPDVYLPHYQISFEHTPIYL